MNPLIHIFEETACPDIEALEKYAEAKSSEKERFAIEQHLLDCELCSDAIEGLEYIDSSKSLHARLKALKDAQRKRLYKKVDKREQLSKRQSRVRPMKLAPYLVPAAAAAAFLIAVVFVFNRTASDDQSAFAETQTQLEQAPASSSFAQEAMPPAVMDSSLIAMAEEPGEESPQPIVQGSQPRQRLVERNQPPAPGGTIAEPPVIQAETFALKEEAQELEAEDDIMIAARTAKPMDEAANGIAVEAKRREVSSATSPATPAGKSVELAETSDDEVQAMEAELNQVLLPEPSPSVVEEDSGHVDWGKAFSQRYDRKKLKPVSYDDRDYQQQTKFEVLSEVRQEAIQHYEQENFNTAILMFEEVLAGKEGDMEVYFYMAKSYMGIKDYKKAQSYFRKVKKWQCAKLYS